MSRRTGITVGVIFAAILGFSAAAAGISNAADDPRVGNPGDKRDTAFSKSRCNEKGEALKEAGLVDEFECVEKILKVDAGLSRNSNLAAFDSVDDCEDAINDEGDTCEEGFALIQTQ